MKYAEEVNYWKTSRTTSDTWIDRSKSEIASIGGEILGEMYGSEGITGRAAFMLAFRIGPDQFKLIWPILESKTGAMSAAKIQAATALYHDVKARCVAAKFLGSRTAFFSALLLPNGQTASEVSNVDFLAAVPRIMQLPEKAD